MVNVDGCGGLKTAKMVKYAVSNDGENEHGQLPVAILFAYVTGVHMEDQEHASEISIS